MILRRVIAHFRKQEWTAIAIDFVIVVMGVFIGIQVANWNAVRADELGYRDAMRRLAEESAETLQAAAEVRALIKSWLADVQAAIVVLDACETGDAAETIVNRGLNVIRSAVSASAGTLTIDRLVVDERLLARQSEQQRARLRRYHSGLHAINETAAFVQGTTGAGDDASPLIGFSGLVDPKETFNGVDVRRARVNAPLAEACKDDQFLKKFYKWERAHVFQLKLIGDLEALVNENAAALGLTDMTPQPQGNEP